MVDGDIVYTEGINQSVPMGKEIKNIFRSLGIVYQTFCEDKMRHIYFLPGSHTRRIQYRICSQSQPGINDYGMDSLFPDLNLSVGNWNEVCVTLCCALS